MSTFIRWCRALALAGAVQMGLLAPTLAADEPDLIFKRSTVFKWLTPNDKLATYGIDDPEVDGVACHFTVPERGGLSGWIGVAEGGLGRSALIWLAFLAPEITHQRPAPAAVCFFGGRGIPLEIAVGRAECESERASEMVEPRLRRGADCESDLHPLATRLGHFGQRRHIPVRHP
jgi:hypothetical protein